MEVPKGGMVEAKGHVMTTERNSLNTPFLEKAAALLIVNGNKTSACSRSPTICNKSQELGKDCCTPRLGRTRVTYVPERHHGNNTTTCNKS